MLVKIFFYLIICPATLAFVLGMLANVLKTIENGSTSKESDTTVSTILGDS